MSKDGDTFYTADVVQRFRDVASRLLRVVPVGSEFHRANRTPVPRGNWCQSYPTDSQIYANLLNFQGEHDEAGLFMGFEHV